MNPHLEQRIANRVKVEVAKVVQFDLEKPDPEPIQYGHFLVEDYNLDSLDRINLGIEIADRLDVPDSLMDQTDECKTVGEVIELAKQAYQETHGEKEVV